MLKTRYIHLCLSTLDMRLILHHYLINCTLFNLDQIRQFKTGIFMYMYRANHNLLPAIFQNYMYFINIKDILDHFTRGSDALFHTAIRTNYRKFSITYMGSVLWNGLPRLIRDMSNLSSFKKVLHNYLLHN